MSRLSAAYYGYSHQDCVVAYALATLLLPRSSYRTITADRKALDGDCFDDMELAGKRRRRVQIKAHSTEPRHLQLADFTTKAISFRIDTSIRSICKDPDPADEYRLLATYDQPESALLPFLEPDLSTPPLLPGLATQRFRLDSSRIWPDGESPVWPHITDIGREAFILLCKRLVVEVGCPRSSGDLRRPGPLERALLDMLRNRIGIGTWPNHNRDLADAAAHLIYAAGLARITSATCDQHTVIDTLALVIDYGRVEERFPIDDHRLVPRDESLDEIVTMLTESPRLTIIGSPGIGKSWLLCQLVERLLDSGWLVASHYCFVGLLDVDRSRRASLETTFGSIIAELLDADPSLATDSAPRFAAGPRELQQLLDAAAEESSDRRIAIIIDGLDHADRIPQSPKTGVAADIVEELAMLSLPPNVSVVIGSQPGEHLTSFLDVGTEYRVCRWRSESIRELAKCMGTVEALYDGSLGDDTERVLDVIAAKADGNPLYATYLARTVIALAGQDADTILTGDIVEYLAGVPAFDQDLDAYYQWLVTALARDTGAYWTAELLSLLDFSVSADELRQIRPEFSHHIDIILSCLSPILVEDITQGGFRVYHESFQRYMLQRLEADPGADISAILAPVINWLEARGFFADIRAFRSLLRLMHKAGRDTEVIAHVGEDFVASAAAHGQPADAVLANLSIAATTATARQDWLALAHLIEVSRAADHLYGWRLIDHRIAEAYGRAYAALFGPNSLADCLLHSGRCTFLPRPGLLLCHLCDEQGAIPPWTEYLTAHDLQRQIERVDYGTESDVAIQSARLTGRLRISGREQPYVSI